MHTTFYFHGAPGSPCELRLFGATQPSVLAPDRFVDRLQLPFDVYMRAMSQDVAEQAHGAPVHLIGFSLGARVALEVAGRLQQQVACVDLISPAAPLELGDFLLRMRGRAIFTVARDVPHLLPALTWVQAQAAQRSPRRLLTALFAGGAAADAALLSDPQFVAALVSILRHALGTGAPGYRREVLAYVKPWSAMLSRVTSPVRIWQGVADDWTPPAMARALQAALPQAEPLHLEEGLGHFTTLGAALERISACA